MLGVKGGGPGAGPRLSVVQNPRLRLWASYIQPEAT